jgi:hypothetical protein
MKVARICSLLLLAGVLAQAETAWADGWSLGNLVPFAKSDKGKSTHKQSNRPSVLEQVGTGTKKVASTTADIVTLKWLAPKEKPVEPEYRWAHRSRKTEPSKKSFLDFLFPPKKPPKPKTMEEWMAQERPYP